MRGISVNSIIRRLFQAKRGHWAGDLAITGVETRAPSHQNAIDLLPGWNHAFPEQCGVKAGDVVLYNDPRIHWALEQFGSIAGKRVLELGPLEASHTSMLDRCDPAVLDAVEANTASYMRCLIAKQVLDLRRAKFHLGNFVPWLERNNLSYDLIVGSGVLYHMSNPVRLLDLISRRADAVYLWTHYYDAQAMPPGDLRAIPFSGRHRTARRRKVTVRLHARHYFGAEQNPKFCGGPGDLHYWMEKSDIIAVLQSLGFDDVRTAHDEPSHQNGPSVSIFARRTIRRVP
jgi:hypothetical protein